MDAREYVKIVKENCFTGRKCNECPFFVGVQCTAGVWSTGIKDPVAIAEEIKAEQDKPKPAKQFEPGKRYRFSAALKQKDLGYEDPLDAKDDGEEITVIEIRYVSKKEPDVIGYLASGGVYPQWCYEVPADKPQLPGKVKNWGGCEDGVTKGLRIATNALIDYLKAREK